MKAYKGFNKDMTCTPDGKAFQFEEGKTYEEAEAKLCKSGFHACENPLDCWGYYNILNSVVHEVELEGVSEEREKNNTKICAKKITIGARIDIKGIVKASVDFVIESVKECFDKKLFDKKTGNENDWAKIGSSGDLAQIGSSGDGAQIGSSGDWAQIGSSGGGAQIGSSGYGAKIDISGERSIGVCIGNNGRVRAKAGCWIVLSEWKNTDIKNTPVCVKAVQVDGETIKEDTWYKLENGEIVEATE